MVPLPVAVHAYLQRVCAYHAAVERASPAARGFAAAARAKQDTLLGAAEVLLWCLQRHASALPLPSPVLVQAAVDAVLAAQGRMLHWHSMEEAFDGMRRSGALPL